MTRVMLFDFPTFADFYGYEIGSFDPYPFLESSGKWGLSSLINWGVTGWSKSRSISSTAAGIDRLYRERDPGYLKLVDAFMDQYHDVDLLVMSTFNFLHPEILDKEFARVFKVLGFIDDPMSTYRTGLSSLWGFDAAFFISPHYMNGVSFREALARWSGKPSYWWPLTNIMPTPSNADSSFFADRPKKLVYVGRAESSKTDRLRIIKSALGSDFEVWGRWPLKGYYGFARPLLKESLYPHHVKALSREERSTLYWRTQIGFNMHVTPHTAECGNMRTYEVPAHGMMLLSNAVTGDYQNQIFEDRKEAVYYKSLDEAIDLARYYLDHATERIQIAEAGYRRFWSDYTFESCLLGFLNWCSGQADSRVHMQRDESY